ncbi:MAG: hypothetical protein AB1546_06660 [bacterium]
MKIRKIAISLTGGDEANLQIEVKNAASSPSRPAHLRLDFYDTTDRRFQSVTVTLPKIPAGATHQCNRYIRLRQKDFFRYTVSHRELSENK